MKIKFKHELTQAYWAGTLTAKLYNTYYTRDDLPSVVHCMRDFRYLRTLFGKYYNLLKSNRYCNSYVLKYEEFNQLSLDEPLIGTFEYFMIGFSDVIKKQRL